GTVAGRQRALVRAAVSLLREVMGASAPVIILPLADAPIDAVRTVQYSDKKAQSKRWSATRAKRGSGYGGGTNRNGGDFGRGDSNELPPGAGFASQPVLYVGLHHRHQQHAAAAPAERVRAELYADHADRERVVHRLCGDGDAL